jgi:S-adenosylhomocysteine hydrolase
MFAQRTIAMTKLVEQALAAISKLPPETQDELARLMLALASGAPTPLTPDEAAAIAEAEAEIGRGERVPAETIQAFWQSHGL